MKRYEQTICPDCAKKEKHPWHVYIRYYGFPKRYKCEKCGRLYYENEDE